MKHQANNADKRFFLRMSTAWIILMIVVSLGFSSFAVDLTTTVYVDNGNLAVNSNDVTDVVHWKSEKQGTVKWTAQSGKETTGSGCNTTTTYKQKFGELVLTNNSGAAKVLSFNYTVTLNGGSVTIGKTEVNSDVANASFSQTLGSGDSITIKSSTSKDNANGTTVTLSDINLDVQKVTVTFAPPKNGSYTVTVDGKSYGSSETDSIPFEKSSTTPYKLVATPADNYVFAGWYLGDTLYSTEKTIDEAIFQAGGTVSASFSLDPLYSVAQTGELGGDLSKYILVDSDYSHSAKGSRHTVAGDMQNPVNNTYGPPFYFPNSVWSISGNTVVSSASGISHGDVQTEKGYSNARAFLYSDIIRIKCLQSCTISFTAKLDAASMDSPSDTNIKPGVYFYYYKSTSASADASAIKANGVLLVDGYQKSSAEASSGAIALNAGDYLYLYSYGETLKSKMRLLTGTVVAEDSYSYTSKISNFTVSPANATSTLTIANYDNAGNQLASGTVYVDGTAQNVSTAYSATAQQGTVCTLKPGTAPTGYTFLGWQIDDTLVYTQLEYQLTLTADTAVRALYVPAMTITAGGTNGYGSATYTLSGTSYNTGSNPYYVARDKDCANFYTDLNAAFNGTDTVVLLAGHTISGDMTIPSGKTLVIPYGHADNGISGADPDQTTTYSSTTNYCVVTYNGNLTVDGTLLVNGLQSGYSTYSGRPSGGIGCLKLGDSSVVTLNGILYAFGHVRGGTINAASGSAVHETVEFGDTRSILVMKAIVDSKDNKVLPCSHLSVESVESTVTYAKGATLYGHFSILMQGNSTNSYGFTPIIGTYTGDKTDAGWLRISEGSLTKYYDFSQNQMVYRIDQGSTVSTYGVSFTFSYSHAGQNATIDMKSEEYYMPLDQNYCIQVAGNLSFKSDHKFLPGAKLVVEETGVCTIDSGVNVVLYRMNDYDTRAAGQELNYLGYCQYASPVHNLYYPLGGYAAKKTLATTGSASLHVDGKMVVKGGLYVTEDLVSESDQGISDTTDESGSTVSRKAVNASYFTKYDNGYNILTGFGTIDMSGASIPINDIFIYEAMLASGTNTPHYDQVKVVPVKGLNAAETPQYESLSGVRYGVTNPNGMNVWVEDACVFGHQLEKTEAKEATCLENGNSEYYTCTKCKKFFSDAECTIPIDENSWIIPANGHSLTGIPAQEPTCTAAGNAAYWQCNNCGQFYSDANAEIQIEKDSWVREILPHEYNEETVAPSCMAMGCTTYTCSRCGDSYQVFSELVDHAWDENGVCTVCGFSKNAPGISYVSVTMANSLDMNFAFELPEGTSPDGCKVVFTSTTRGAKDQEVPYSKWKTTTINGNPYYYASYTGLAAKEMPDMVYAAVRDGEGNLLCAVRGDSIQKQAMRNLAQTQNDLAKTMVVDMLNYGAAAQTKFGYRTDNLANSQLTEAQKALASTYSPGDSTPINTGCNIIYMANVKLESNIQFMIGLQNVTDSMTAHIAFTDHYGKEKDVEVPLSSFSKDKTTEPITYVYTFDKTVIADARQPITITIKNSEGATVATITDSIANYAARAEDTSEYKKLYECIVKFADSAHAFLHPQQN